jgi:hypothetical protein
MKPRIRPVHGQMQALAACCLRLQIKWPAATFPRPLSIHVVVTAARAPIGVAMRWRQRHPCPRHHDERSGQDQGTGQEQGGTRQMERTSSPCPPRALQGSHSRSFTATHGQPKPLLTSSVLTKSCNSQAIDQHRCLRRASLRDSSKTGPR